MRAIVMHGFTISKGPLNLKELYPVPRGTVVEVLRTRTDELIDIKVQFPDEVATCAVSKFRLNPSRQWTKV